MTDRPKLTCRHCLRGPILDPNKERYCDLRDVSEQGSDGTWHWVDRSGDPDHEICQDSFELPLEDFYGDYVIQDGCWNCGAHQIMVAFDEGWIAHHPNLLCHKKIKFVDAAGKCGSWMPAGKDEHGRPDVLCSYARMSCYEDRRDAANGGVESPSEENVDEGKEPEADGSGIPE